MAENNSGWTGWVYFAGILLVIDGIARAILGVGELAQKHLFFVVNNSALYSATYYNTWGWVDLILGIILVAAGFSLLHGSLWARIVGSFVAAMGLISSLLFFPIYPGWAIVSGIIDGFILYALVVHGGDLAQKK